jgi:peptidoglycan/xylan/chitin deacetylase (PgdA/CDA1 family)
MSASVRERLGNRSADAVFLCYHSVADDGPPWLSLPVEIFERQLGVLRRRGYRSGGLRELEQLAAGSTVGRPLVFLTFDDGFADTATVVAPLLGELGWTALVFLLPPAVDEGAALDWPEVRAGRARYPEVMRSLDWTAVDRMAAAGIEFGSHTSSHLHLPSLSDEELGQELLDSRRRISERLGACETLAYPFGAWDGRVARAAAAAGYRFAFTCPVGAQRSATRLTIPRIPVDARDDERRFRLKLMSGTRRLLLSNARPLARALRDRSRVDALSRVEV